MRVKRLGSSCIAIDFAGEEERIGIFKERSEAPVIELHDGLAEELLAALRALLEKKP